MCLGFNLSVYTRVNSYAMPLLSSDFKAHFVDLSPVVIQAMGVPKITYLL